MDGLRPKLILVQMMVTIGCLSLIAASCDNGKTERKPRPAREVPVVTQLLEYVNEPRWVTTVAQLQGKQQVDVFPRVAGRLTNISKKEGSKVTKGEVLFHVQRQEPGENFLSTPITSPITGWIGRWVVRDIGEQVTTQNPVVTVVDDDQLKAVVLLPYTDWLEVSPSTTVKVVVGHQERPAKVNSIARAADARSGQGRVEVVLDNKDHQLKAGVVANIHFGLDHKDRLLLKASALVLTDTGSFVYVVDEETVTAKRIPVTYRLIDNDNVEILEGLKSGDVIVTVGANQLSDNASVKVIEPQEETSQKPGQVEQSEQL